MDDARKMRLEGWMSICALKEQTPVDMEEEGMDVHLGIEGKNSNGHGEGRDENMNMVEIIKNL
jgi:hypothetical protein